YNQAYIAKIKALEVAGLQENNNELAFNIYPNPSNNVVNFTYKSSIQQNLAITISNQLGQQILKKQYSAQTEIKDTYNFNNISKGIYFIELKSNNGREVRKVVIE
nr:T9SS type A sorting domain-containing protein [Bacteroidota bacterium]